MITDQFVTQYTKLVIHLAKSLHPSNSTELDEFIQYGYLGLVKAFQNYDSSRKNKFSTVAWMYIRNEIIKYIKYCYKHKKCNHYNVDTCTYLETMGFQELIPSCLTNTEFTVVNLKCQGYNFTEISKLIPSIKNRKQSSKIYHNAISKIKKANK